MEGGKKHSQLWWAVNQKVFLEVHVTKQVTVVTRNGGGLSWFEGKVNTFHFARIRWKVQDVFQDFDFQKVLEGEVKQIFLG